MSFSSKFKGIKQIWQFDNRWQLLFTRAFFSNEDLNIYKYKGIEFLTDHKNGEANGARELLTTEMYKRFLAQMNFSEPIKVLDLGANNGGFPLLLKSENIEIEKLVCVELNPKTFSRMRFNVERNISADFIPVNAAVCGENKTLSLSLGEGGTSDNIYNAEKSGNSSSKVSGKSFDSIFTENFGDEIVDLCKIDVEGAEFEILKSDECKKIKNCKFILMEIHHETYRKRSELLKLMPPLNFTELNEIRTNDDDTNHYVHFFENKNI